MPKSPAAEEATSVGEAYQSNPLKLVWQSFKALGVNLGPLFGFIFLPLGIILSLLTAGGIAALLTLGLFHVTGLGISLFVVVAAVLVYFSFYLLFITAAGQRAMELANARGQKATFKQLWEVGRPRAWRLAGAGLLAGLAIGAGFILLVIPGVILAVRYSLVPYVVLDEDIKATAGLRRSWTLTRGHFLELFSVMCLTAVTGLLANIPQVGYLIYPLSVALGLAIGVALAYRYLGYRAVERGAQAPARHPLNLVLTLILPAVGLLGLIWAVVTGLQIYRDARHPATVTTACYSLKLPSSYHPTANGTGCRIEGHQGQSVIQAYPIDTSASDIEGFYHQARHDVYAKNELVAFDTKSKLDFFNQVTLDKAAIDRQPDNLTIDGQPAIHETFQIKNQEAGDLFFLYNSSGYQVNGRLMRGFLLIRRIKNLGGLSTLFTDPSQSWRWASNSTAAPSH